MKINPNLLIAASAIAILGSGTALLASGCPFKNKSAANNQITEVKQPLKTAKAVSASLLLGGAAIGGVFAVKRWQNQRQQSQQQATMYQKLEFPSDLPDRGEELVNISEIKK